MLWAFKVLCEKMLDVISIKETFSHKQNALDVGKSEKAL